MKLIRFRRLNRPLETVEGIRVMLDGKLAPVTLRLERWEIALNDDDLKQKLNGEMAEVIMPAKPWYVRLWRRLFPLRGVEITEDNGLISL